jgi:hypothetical protein
MLLGQVSGDQTLVAALRDGGDPVDPRLAALARFTRDVLRRTGNVSPDRLVEAGFSTENVLDVVVGIATYAMTTFASRITSPRRTAASE